MGCCLCRSRLFAVDSVHDLPDHGVDGRVDLVAHHGDGVGPNLQIIPGLVRAGRVTVRQEAEARHQEKGQRKGKSGFNYTGPSVHR